VPIHIRAEAGEIAPLAFLAGDPGRASTMAGLLHGARCYNENRGLLGFTGSHGGVPVSVQTTGMGGPSAAIVVEELATLGVQTVVRLGTCGAIGAGIGVLDLFIATAAVPMDGTTRQYSEGEPFAPVADFAVTRALATAAAGVARPVHIGLGMSQDAFYREAEGWAEWRARGVLAVEMEAAAVFTVALHRGLRAGVVCLVVDKVDQPETWASDAAIAEGTADLLMLGLAAVPALSALAPLLPPMGRALPR
jgi:purine-nucleoside phosphorylase